MGYKLIGRYDEGMGTRIKGKAKKMTVGVQVGNRLRFCRENRNYCLIKGKYLRGWGTQYEHFPDLSKNEAGTGLGQLRNLVERKSRHEQQILFLDCILLPRFWGNLILDSRPVRPYLRYACMDHLFMVYISLENEFGNNYFSPKQKQKAKQRSKKKSTQCCRGCRKVEEENAFPILPAINENDQQEMAGLEFSKE